MPYRCGVSFCIPIIAASRTCLVRPSNVLSKLRLLQYHGLQLRQRQQLVCRVTGSGGTDGALTGVVTGGMTDASKRFPEDADWEPVDGSETLDSASAVAAFLEENNAIPVPWLPMEGTTMVDVRLDAWYPPSDYDGGDTRIPIPKGVANAREWGKTVVTMAKCANGTSTFQDMVRMAMGGSKEHIKYLCFIKEKFKTRISNEPASPGNDLCAFLYFLRFEPPPVTTVRYQRTYCS